MGAPYGDHIDPNRFSGTQEHHAEYLIRTCLRYEVLEAALAHTLAMMRKVRARFARASPAGVRRIRARILRSWNSF